MARQTSEPKFANTNLARLCRYYLACLGHDDTGVSTFLTSKFDKTDYFEVDTLPQSTEDLADNSAGKALLGRQREERGNYSLYFGYPTNIALLKSRRTKWQGYMVEPIFLFPIEQDADSGHLLIDLSYPIINQKPFQSFTNAERDTMMNEIAQLERDIGISTDEPRIDISDIATRLRSVRPEWTWKEEITPQVFENESEREREPIANITEAGIYNRAVVIMAEKPPFTKGLEHELRTLAQLSEAEYEDTALGGLIAEKDTASDDIAPYTEPLLEVFPMNTEQREAIKSALTQPKTIITGPPGTGKSQVITNLLANAAWSGKRVLFASKNNKAVDVVEGRINALGARASLLRVGAQEAFQSRLAEYVLSLLSSRAEDADHEEFKNAKEKHQQCCANYERLSAEEENTVELRNKVDKLEQSSMEARRQLEGVTFWGHSFWSLLRRQKLANFSLNQEKDSTRKRRFSLYQTIKSIGALIETNIYLQALKKLQNARSLEDIALEKYKILDEIANHSKTLWELWLRVQPASLSTTERQNLGKYTTLLKMVVDASSNEPLSWQVRQKYNDMLHEIAHLLPCWAVTSLSARGRIPLEANNFDLVVFDEASQCDIASALPLLFRAKSVVIIGDPKQLEHISQLKRGQDQILLERYNLLDNFSHWSYEHQSLYGLGAIYEPPIRLVDHYRSHADIINFSNNEWYEGNLRIATDYAKLRFPDSSQSGIQWIDIKGKAMRPQNGSVLNQDEAEAVLDTLRDLVLIKNYQGSIGVVTPFRAQANAIREAINRDEKLDSILAQRFFLVDTAHKFQGDERDVMIFSPVVSSNFPSSAFGFLRSTGNIFNVAISRARAQLIVVGDFSACASCDINYLSRFAAYTKLLENQEKNLSVPQQENFGEFYPEIANPELVSEWEKIFYMAAYAAGYRLIPQYSIEKYIVDFLLIKDDRKLVIEIDGEHYHRNWTGELCRRDQIRNHRLFELGYDFKRFWVYEVRDDIHGCLQQLSQWRG